LRSSKGINEGCGEGKILFNCKEELISLDERIVDGLPFVEIKLFDSESRERVGDIDKREL
jgi:hypothetical protein